MKRIITLAFAAVLLIGVRAHAIDLTELNGSDLGLGVGARGIAMGGAFTGLADDSSAMYWNPAGITQLEKSEVSIMADANPLRYSYKALVYKPKPRNGKPATWAVGVAQINRLKFIGEGDWGQGNAGQLIDLSMIAVERNYVGGLNSRTVDHRATFATKIPHHENISFGLNYIDFKCTTTFFGTGSGRVCQIVAYRTMDFGLLWQKDKNTRIGFTMRNPFEQTKPKYMNIGVARFRGRDTFTFDMERIYGEYSSHLRKARFFLVRTGMERDMGSNWKARAGLIFPLQAWTSTLGNIRDSIPNPKVNLTLGAGYTWHKDTSLDFAVYGDPGRSYIERKLNFAGALSLTQRF